MALSKTEVSELYVALFGRASEGEGSAYWRGFSDSSTAIDSMLGLSVVQDYFGDSINTNQAFIEHIYLNTLNKTETDDAAGIAYWTSLLDGGSKSRAEVIDGLIDASKSSVNAGDAQDQFNNRVEVSDYTADTVQTAPSDYATSLSFSGDLVVTSNSSTVTSSKGNVDGMKSSEESTSNALTREELDTLISNYTENPTDENAQLVINADTSEITDMVLLFGDNTTFNLDISLWNVSSLTNMNGMFYNAANFNQDISSWDVSNVTSMANMFVYAESFNQDISSWDVSNVFNMNGMFNMSESFNQDISSWDVSNVTEYGFFNNEGVIESTNLPNLGVTPTIIEEEIDTEEEIETSTGPLTRAELDTLINNYEDSPTNVNAQVIINANTSEITDMSELFKYKSDFNLDISSWNVSNVTDMSSMFYYAQNFNQDISSWDVSSVTAMESMFYKAKNFNQDISSWNVSSITQMSNMFNAAQNFNQDISSWDVSNAQDMYFMFAYTESFNQDISSWDVSNIVHYNGFDYNTQMDTNDLPNFGGTTSSLISVEELVSDILYTDSIDNDFIVTSSEDDSISLGNGGHDIVDGGEGTDTLYFNDDISEFTLEETNESYLIYSDDYTVELINIETIVFNDETIFIA